MSFRRMTRPMSKLAISLLVVLAAALAACGGGPAATPAGPGGPAPEQGLNVGMGSLTRSLDPAFDGSLHVTSVYTLLYDSLVRLDDRGNLQPGLAESWKTLDDKTWQFKLRRG